MVAHGIIAMRFFGKSLLDALSATIPANLQRRLIDYALRKLLGSFVRKDLSLDDLDLRLRDGAISLANLDLRVEVSSALRMSRTVV